MGKYHISLEPEKCYHIYNQVVGSEILFRNDEQFRKFLSKYSRHTSPICDTYCYNLLPDHFHFIIKIKPEKHCIEYFETIKEISFDSAIHNISDFLMERFSNMCNSYSKSYNHVQSRKGSLFIDYMKRYEIQNDEMMLKLINYIHYNSAYHGICNDLRNWSWSSFNIFLSEKSTRLKRDEVINLFGGIDKFITAHSKMQDAFPEYEFL